jgi:hypothetical protein
MSLDLLTIADNLATRYTTLTPPTNPVTSTAYPAIRGATARTPNNVSAFPYVVVELPDGEYTIGGGERAATHDFDVYFLYDKASGDIPRDKVAMLRWIGVLIDATHPASLLGLAGTVLKALTMSSEYGIYEYSGTQFHAWHLVVRVWTRDVVTLVAA